MTRFIAQLIDRAMDFNARVNAAPVCGRPPGTLLFAGVALSPAPVIEALEKPRGWNVVYALHTTAWLPVSPPIYQAVSVPLEFDVRVRVAEEVMLPVVVPGRWDWRAPPGVAPRGIYLATDALTGEVIPRLFFYDEETSVLGRYATHPTGRLVTPRTPIWEIREVRLETTADA